MIVSARYARGSVFYSLPSAVGEFRGWNRVAPSTLDMNFQSFYSYGDDTWSETRNRNGESVAIYIFLYIFFFSLYFFLLEGKIVATGGENISRVNVV